MIDWRSERNLRAQATLTKPERIKSRSRSRQAGAAAAQARASGSVVRTLRADRKAYCRKSSPNIMKVATAVLLVLALAIIPNSSVDAFFRLGNAEIDDQKDDATDDTTTTTDDSTGDDGGLLPEDQPCDANWEQTKADYEENVAKWGSPDCYSFTIQRGCFCSDVIRRPARVRVENGVVVAPADYQELFLRPMSALFDEVFRLCVKDCPDRGAARCDVTYGMAGNLASVFIDRSLMIADEEISYEIYNYTTCSLT